MKKLPSIARGITAQKAYKNAQEAPPFQARFRIIDSKYLLLGLIYLMGVGLQPVHKDQGVSRFYQSMLFCIVEML